MQKSVTRLLIFAAATSLACCARPTMQSQKSPQPKQQKERASTGTQKTQPTSREQEAPEEPAEERAPASVPAPAPKLKKKRAVRVPRGTGGGGGVKPLEADMGDMSTDSAHSHRALEIQMIRNMEASFVRRFRRMALISLSNKRCARHADGNSALAKVSYDSADDIHLSGVQGALASCIKSVFTIIAPSSLSHRTDDSRPVEVHIYFRGE